MRVVNINDTLGRGGTETSILELSRWMKSAGVNASIITLAGPVIVDEDPSVNVEIVYLDAHPRNHLLRSTNRLRKSIANESPDILHVHSFFGLFLVRLSSLFSSRPRCVATLHNQGYRAWPAKTVRQKIRKRVHGFLLSQADAVVSVSHAVARHYEQELGVESDAIIPDPLPELALNLSDSPPPTREKSAVLKIAVPGRLVREKGQELALEALAQLRLKRIEARLLLLGGGPEEAGLRDVIKRLELDSCVEISGVLPHVQLLQRLREADLCLIPSKQEGLGIVALEAMAMSVPVIATAVGGLKETISHGDTGLLVKPGSIAEVCEAIESLAGDRVMRSRLTDAAKKSVRENYSLDVIGERWIALYASLGVRH